MLTLSDIERAAARIKPHLRETPLLTSSKIDDAFGHRFFFKVEALQKAGAFKARGALNTLLWAQENKCLTPTVLAVSSGNHAQAVAWAAKLMGVKARIFMTKTVSKIKMAATQAYGAEIILTESRQAAEAAVREEAKAGLLFVPPYDHDQVICGQGTACLEATRQTTKNFDAVFAPIGGGGLLSGTFIAAKALGIAHVFGVEPLPANDAAQSFRKGSIVALDTLPDTICDGVQTLSMSERTFSYVKQCNGIIEASDESVCKATQWLTHLLKVTIEPTSSLAFVGAASWAKAQTSPQSMLVILSGGNMDFAKRKLVYQRDWIESVCLADLAKSF